MTRSVQARLSRLEAATPSPGRIVPMFVWGKSDAEVAAEQADLVRRGVASPRDKFQVFTWMEEAEMPPLRTPGG
jgi:hypothetical protein